MSFCKYCPAGFQSTVEREEHERECPRRASPTTKEGGEVVESARRIVAWDDNGRLADDEWLVERNETAIIAICRALLSSPREERARALEEAAQIADIYVAYAPATEDGDEAARKIAAAIRSLSPTDGAPANPPKVRTP